VLSIGRLHHHHQRCRTTPLSNPTPLHGRFARRARNRTTALDFRVFRPRPPPPLARSNAHTHYHHHLVHTNTAPPPISLHRRLPRHSQNRATALGFRVFRPQPPPPLARSNAHTHHHHHLVHTNPAPPPIFLRRRLPRHIQNRATALDFRVFSPRPPPPLARSNAHTHHHHHLVHTNPAPFPISLHRRLPRHTQNRATACGFRVFRPQPPPPLARSNAHTHHHHHLLHTNPASSPIVLHCPLPRHTKNRATALGFRVFGFLGPGPLPLTRAQTRTPTTTTTLSTPTQRLPLLPCTAVSRGTPKTEPLRSVFGIF
jgi:hypothetical protein